MSDDYIKFEDLGVEGQNFIAGNKQYKIDDKEIEAEADKMMGGPMTAVETLLEECFITEPLYEMITCRYESIKHTLSDEAFSQMHDTMMANAYQYSLVYGTLKEGFASQEKVIYFNPETGETYSGAEKIIDNIKDEKGVMFVSATRINNEHKLTFHVIGFVDNKIVIKSDDIPESERGWISFDYKGQLPLEEGESDET